MRFTPLLFLSIASLALALVAACGGGADTEPQSTATSAVATSTPIQSPTTQPSPTAEPSPSPTETPEPQAQSFIEWGDEDCILRFSGELGELTTINRTYVENDPKQNIERVFLRFHQSEMDSTILRCDLRTAGLFATWWIQSVPEEDEAFQLYETLIEITTPEVVKLNQNPFSCAQVRARRGTEGDRYLLDFVDRGLCDSSIFNGMSGLVVYGNTVIGVDSQFYEEFFDVIVDHAKSVVDKRVNL